MIDFQRNNVFRIRGYNENSVNKGNLNKTGAVDSYIPIPLALITSITYPNLENFHFKIFVSVIYFGVFVFDIISRWE